MSLNSTPQSVRVHIGLFGKRNAGKSSLINALTNQSAAIVSDIPGTTTDPVFRPMEILPIGPCVLIDTAGLDDVGDLGKLRVNKSLDVLNKTDIGLLIVDSSVGICEDDLSLIEIFTSKNIPHILVLNKADMLQSPNNTLKKIKKIVKCPIVIISSTEKTGLEALKKEIINTLPENSGDFKILTNLVEPNDFVILVVPIDKADPKGRLILPQQQVIREILDIGAISIVVKEDNLKNTLDNLPINPKLVITDSQVFENVAKDTPENIALTSFSMLFARQKGDLDELIKGAYSLENLKDGDKILMAEGCTHHRQIDDIGTVKIPNMIKTKTKKDLTFEFTSGVSFTEDIARYALVVHCGGCMMNRSSMLSRIEKSKSFNVPIVNYGVLIAYTKGILERSIKPLKDCSYEY